MSFFKLTYWHDPDWQVKPVEAVHGHDEHDDPWNEASYFS